MPSTPQQRIRQERVNSMIRLAAPALDLVLSTADRASRLLFGEDRDYYPIRSAAEAGALEDLRRNPIERRGRLETVD